MMKSRSAAAPFGIWMTLFTIVPLGIVVWYAFTDKSGAFTFDNIRAIGDYAGTFLSSVAMGAIATVICLVLAYPLAFSISRASERAQQTMVMIIMLPMWMNFLLRTYAWMSLLENNGFINQLLGLIGLGPVNMINTSGAVVLGMVYNFLPFMVLPLYSVMVKIDVRVIEAAQDLGANSLQVLRRVLLPLSVPGIVTGITMVFVPAVSTFVISKLLGGGKQMMIGDFIEMFFLGNAPNYNVGAALSLVLMILILICMGIMNLVDKDDEDGGGLMV
ncbi:MAG: ABC transporter permease [Clostridiales bacterium]|jgi:spermidine/putrescine transport system permease protein|nr:ABC transporter permease [Clostridiales bacterium]